MTHPSEPENQDEPKQLRFLRRLVTALTAIMVGGVLVVIALLVIRLSQEDTPALPALPQGAELPAGATLRAITFGEGWIAVVLDSDAQQISSEAPKGAPTQEILILDPTSGALRQRFVID